MKRDCGGKRFAALKLGKNGRAIQPAGAHALARQTQRILECGGKRSATPLSPARRVPSSRRPLARTKAPSPLRSAGALQIRILN
jgi:hypothetical protein